MMKARGCQKESAGAGVGPIKPGLQEEDSDRVALIRGLFGPGQEQILNPPEARSPQLNSQLDNFNI